MTRSAFSYMYTCNMILLRQGLRHTMEYHTYLLLLGIFFPVAHASFEADMKRILPTCTIIDKYMEKTRCLDPVNMEANEDRIVMEEECRCPEYQGCFLKVINEISDGNTIVDMASAQKRYICKSKKTLEAERKKFMEATNHAANG
ncbi:uncharacterized protein LOC125653586 [Ostrea edulis]|uniref:uncharacterized protein LOC125653586 n=1 Tax=Ostrea edulis TaxID=37623 RepID=UPI0024AED2A6|nr:uncharacterized protein LOC125653586 [Ostrea edulis]